MKSSNHHEITIESPLNHQISMEALVSHPLPPGRSTGVTAQTASQIPAPRPQITLFIWLNLPGWTMGIIPTKISTKSLEKSEVWTKNWDVPKNRDGIWFDNPASQQVARFQGSCVAVPFRLLGSANSNTPFEDPEIKREHETNSRNGI